jgi:glycosyltransferase involved in cell wall biosynthesis
MINYSIIIPHYNIPDLLVRCLQSIPERDDVQVIVVDDNSSGNENYLRDIPELSRKNVEFYITKDGLGAGHARNIGLQKAKGKWLIFSDADDFFSEDINLILDDYSNAQEDVIFFNTCSCLSNNIEKRSNRSYDILFKNYEKTGDRRWFSICYPQPWGKIIRHQLVIDNSITFQETKANNDLVFAVKTGTLAKTIKVVNHLMYCYTYREGSLSVSKGIEPLPKHLDRIKAYYSCQQFLDSRNIKVKFPMYWIPIQSCLPFHLVRYMKCMDYLKSNNISTKGFFRRTLCYCIKYPLYKLHIRKNIGLYDLL